MCGIAGFFNAHADYGARYEQTKNVLEAMNKELAHRGPDDNGVYISKTAALGHNRLSIVDLSLGHQPMVKTVNGKSFGIIYNGEVYNMDALRAQLECKGWKFSTTSDTEVILVSYLEYGYDFVEQLNGIFAFAIADGYKNELILYRDRCGIKPLFYTVQNESVVFASEIKAIFKYPKVKPTLDIHGLNEVFSIGPSKTYGCGIFKDIHEVLPGHYIICSADQRKEIEYWKVKSKPHEDSFEQTVTNTRALLKDAVTLQMKSDVPICTFLSGGIDSSLVSAICAAELSKKGAQLNTFSFDFANNNKYFKSNNFQPSQDRPYAEKMVDYIDSNHHFLECSNVDLVDYLYQSIDARDLPAMADIDASLLYFCGIVKQHNKVVLTGECADEIFGGYPWFHKREFFEKDTFPWMPDLAPRKIMLSDDFLAELQMDAYVKRTYEKSIAETPHLVGETTEEKRRREIAYLNLKWFMQTLLDRMDRTSMFSGLEARVPFADHRIIEYIWNVPWAFKNYNGTVKGLLREASRGLVPDEILFRKKSPYPKVYDPAFERLLKQRLIDVIEDHSSPILQFLDKKKVYSFMASPSNYGKPWFGQLMAGPQMMGYLIQINYWMKKFHIQIV
ncbi:MAG: asparagine synthase (glutamine-hydrolyzing) [Candidatus Fimivivens sp.]